MNRKQRLELSWYNKNEKLKIEPRILVENINLSYSKEIINNIFDTNHCSNNENLLIHGDNLLALKALTNEYSNKIKCIYIDPPYNTGSAFEHYDDNLEHSKWLSLMKPRLELLRDLLSENGAIFISIDDDERDYLKVLCDEVFGRKNFVGALVWEKKKKPSFLSNIGIITEYILIYSKDKNKMDSLYYGKTTKGKKYPINNAGNGAKEIVFPSKSVKFGIEDQIIKPQNMSAGNIITELKSELVIKDGVNQNAFILYGEWRYSQEKINEIIESDEEIHISKIPFRPNHIKTGNEPKKMKNLLSVAHYNVPTNEDATQESRKIFGVSDAFSYPKPEKLISILIESLTDEGDIVLDSFLGSGTTIAVAHKMNRKWIGIEMGEHAYTHCKIRMDKVINGEQGGISKSVNWKGGGGYKFYELAPTLIKEDSFGQTIINPEYNAEMLASAVAKHEGYKYNPDAVNFWKQSTNDSKSYLFVTTKHITKEYLLSISSEMQDDEYLVIVCKSYDSNIQYEFKNIEIKKIPQSLLNNCEYDVDNYNLNIIHPPVYDEEEDLDD